MAQQAALPSSQLHPGDYVALLLERLPQLRLAHARVVLRSFSILGIQEPGILLLGIRRKDPIPWGLTYLSAPGGLCRATAGTASLAQPRTCDGSA